MAHAGVAGTRSSECAADESPATWVRYAFCQCGGSGHHADGLRAAFTVAVDANTRIACASARCAAAADRSASGGVAGGPRSRCSGHYHAGRLAAEPVVLPVFVRRSFGFGCGGYRAGPYGVTVAKGWCAPMALRHRKPGAAAHGERGADCGLRPGIHVVAGARQSAPRSGRRLASATAERPAQLFLRQYSNFG